jgi:3'-phosphoadenosine 5'-phosphosulfate sulfotransferase (PAPS reductase)/FAD synthetase
MIDELIKTLTAGVNSALSPVLAWSGGSDSTLLLHLMLELNLDFSILTFHHLWTREQRQFVVDTVARKQLTVFFYSPVNINYTGKYVTAGYMMGNTLIHTVMDHVPAENCGLDVGRAAVKDSRLQPGYLWDLTIVGTKRTDRHELVDQFNFKDEGGHRFIKPLWDWTDAEVKDEAASRGYELDQRPYPVGDTGSYIACMACMDTKERVYCPKAKQMITGIGLN